MPCFGSTASSTSCSSRYVGVCLPRECLCIYLCVACACVRVFGTSDRVPQTSAYVEVRCQIVRRCAGHGDSSVRCISGLLRRHMGHVASGDHAAIRAVRLAQCDIWTVIFWDVPR